jgi:hypothetical protein
VPQSQPSPAFQWAVNAEPDLLVLQFPLFVVEAGGPPRDPVKVLFERRGFRVLSGLEDLDLQAATGCALTATGPESAELVALIAEDGRATRIPVPHGDPAWSARVLAAGHVPVLVTIAAIGDDGLLTRERLQRDVASGGVLAALVPTGDLA